MAQLGDTIINGGLRVIGGENVDTINGVTVGSSPKFTDTNNAVTQTATTTSANYEVLFSVTADNTTRTEGARKNSNLTFNPSTGNLQATQLNGVNIGTSPKFTDTTYNFGGTTFYSGNSGTAEHNANNAVKNGTYYYSSNGPATSLGASATDGALYVQSYSDTWVGQIAQDYRNGNIFVRGKNSNSWTAWKKVDAGTVNGLTISLVT